MLKPEEILKNFRAKLDSLPESQQQVKDIIEFSTIYGDSFGEKIVSLLEEGIERSKRLKFEAGEILCYYNLAFFQGMTRGAPGYTKYISGKTTPEEMIDKVKHDPYYYSLGMNLLSYFHWFRGDYDKGFNSIFEAIRIAEEDGNNSIGLAWAYYALAVYYFDTKDLDNSELYYNKALFFFEKIDHEYGQARACNGLASVAILKNDLDKAIPLIEKAAKVYREFGQYSGLSRALNDMGLIEKAKKNYAKAIEVFIESIDLRKEIDHVQGIVTSLTELGETYLITKEYDKALVNLSEALDLAKKVNAKQKVIRLHKLLSELYKSTNNIPMALEHFEEFYKLRTELMSDEATNNIRKIQTQFATEKADKEAEIERLKNVELKKAYELIEQKNKDIHDSIVYAQRIQNALITSELYIEKTLNRLMKP